MVLFEVKKDDLAHFITIREFYTDDGGKKMENLTMKVNVLMKMMKQLTKNMLNTFYPNYTNFEVCYFFKQRTNKSGQS